MGSDQPVQQWIDAVCRQFSRATGWRLVFEAFDREAVTQRAPTETNLRSPWRSNVSNGMETVGILSLGPRQSQKRDESYLQACELAELTVRLIERVLITQASNERLRVSHVTLPAGPAGRGVALTVDRGRTDSQPIMFVDRLLRMAMRLSGYPAAALFLRKRGTEELNLYTQLLPAWMELPHPARLLKTSPIDAACFDGGMKILDRESNACENAHWLPEHAAVGVCQGICVSGEPVGTLWMYDRRDRRLTLRDRHVISSVAARLGELIEQTILLDESAHSQRLRVELQVAARSLPAAKNHHQGTEGWCELASRSQASDVVGGDLFEVIPLANDRVFVAIGDAAGHSIPAAMVMASVRGAIRALLDATGDCEHSAWSCSPQVILNRVNSVLHGIVNAHQFMTMFCAILDGRRMRLEYANAGHPPALLIREGEVQSLDTHGLVLGVLDDTTYDGHTVLLRENDLVVFYTDGVTEAVDDAQTMFGVSSIANIAGRHHTDGAAAVVDHVWHSLRAHLSVDAPADDRTLAVLRINGVLSLPRPPSVEPAQGVC